MKNINKNTIINKYKNKVLAIENFGSNSKKYTTDFLDVDDLLYELYQLNCQELSLTDEGVNFIEEYYGINKVIDLILERIKNGVDYKYKKRDEIIGWLKRKGD